MKPDPMTPADLEVNSNIDMWRTNWAHKSNYTDVLATHVATKATPLRITTARLQCPALD